MINLFALGFNQMIAFAEQIQRVEAEMLRLYVRNLSTATERVAEISDIGGKTLLQGAEGAESLARTAASAARSAAPRQQAHSRAKAIPAKRRRSR